MPLLAVMASLLASALAPAAANAATLQAAVTFTIVRPVVLKRVADLNFGSVVMPLVTSAGTVSLSQANVRTCAAQFTCSGATTVASYNLVGTNNTVVVITARPSQLANTTNTGAATLTFTPIAPATVTLANSGNVGTNFTVGGSITLPATTAPGTYTGTIDISADYQ